MHNVTNFTGKEVGVRASCRRGMAPLRLLGLWDLVDAAAGVLEQHRDLSEDLGTVTQLLDMSLVVAGLLCGVQLIHDAAVPPIQLLSDRPHLVRVGSPREALRSPSHRSILPDKPHKRNKPLASTTGWR